MSKQLFDKKNITGNLRLEISENYEDMSETAANIITFSLKKKPSSLLCAATGSTPTLTYQKLVQKISKNQKIKNNLRIIKLDEWGGIPMNDAATCEVYLQTHLIKPLKIPTKRFISFQSNPENPEKEIEKIQKKLENEGGIDICILGIGVNGHLGFNEPTDNLEPYNHIAVLTSTTKQHTMAKKATHKIKYGLTLGVADIMYSKQIILLINGKHKQKIFKKFMTGKVSSRLPASILWLHPNITVICDKDVVEKMPNNF